MTLEEMRTLKERMGYSLKYLSELSGVPAVTLQKVFSGESKKPRPSTLHAIEAVLSNQMQPYKEAVYPLPEEKATVFAETGYNYGTSAKKFPDKKQGEYTLEDYYNIPEDMRVELIDGVIYTMEAPSTVHQDIVFYIHFCIFTHIKNTGKRCKVYEAPVDVQIDEDDRTMLQPDLLLICDREKIEYKKVFGAPDFVLEVLSESTRRKDMSIKLTKYMEAGVREYWIIDPKKKVLIKYNFMDEDFLPEIHTLEEKVSLAVSGNELSIDLLPVKEAIEEFE